MYRLSRGFLTFWWADRQGMAAPVCVCIEGCFTVKHGARDISCCYGDSTVTQTKWERTHWSGFPFKRSDKDLAVNTHRKTIYSLNAIGGHLGTIPLFLWHIHVFSLVCCFLSCHGHHRHSKQYFCNIGDVWLVHMKFTWINGLNKVHLGLVMLLNVSVL